MIRIENVEVMGWEHAIRGMRNPMNSWDKSDSSFGEYNVESCSKCLYNGIQCMKNEFANCINIGPNDLNLMKRLCKSGTDHRKFMRMITVYVDIIAPLYWYKELDTYKVGTVANSCSTMHKIAEKEFTLEDFSNEHLEYTAKINVDESLLIDISDSRDGSNLCSPTDVLEIIIKALNKYRNRYIETKDKTYWWQMIQLLPSSYNQKRTVMLNYEVLANIYKSRKDHKLDEWREFCKWIETLPYSELITGDIPQQSEGDK